MKNNANEEDVPVSRDPLDLHDEAMRLWNVEKDYGEADVRFRQALTRDPNNAAILCNYATFARTVLKDLVSAEQSYQRAVALAPREALIHAVLAGFYITEGFMNKAPQMLRQAWKLCTKWDQRAVVLTLLYWCLNESIHGRDNTPGLCRLKLLLRHGVQGPFSFDAILSCASQKLPADEFSFYSSLAEAILDERNVANLQQCDRWAGLASIPPSHFWSFGSMINNNYQDAEELDMDASVGRHTLLRCLFEQVAERTPPEAGEILPKVSSGGLTATVIASYSGDNGREAGMCFAAAMWLVEHARHFLHAIRAWHSKGSSSTIEDRVELSRKICNALIEEIGLPDEQRTMLISRLFVEVGISLSCDAQEWENESILKIKSSAEEASRIFSGSGYEQYVLPWALETEFADACLSIEDRVSSLRKAIPDKVRDLDISELELNNWAYFLLLVGRFRAATPMAIIATEIARHPRNLDTLGWAYFFEGDTELALQTLSEALEKHDVAVYPEAWAEVAYHKLSVLLHMGRKSDAVELLRNMMRVTSDCYWTQKAKDLAVLAGKDFGGAGKDHAPRSNAYEYDLALSFAGEDRKYVEEVAEALRGHGLSVFYDEFQKAELWGKNLFPYLTDVYLNKARYCVVFISKHYASKRWTRIERDAAFARAFSEEQEYILPIRLDMTSIPGFLPTISYLEWRREGAVGIVECILRKLGRGRV